MRSVSNTTLLYIPTSPVSIVDGIEAGYGTGGDLRTAKEEAARQVLKHLLGPEA